MERYAHFLRKPDDARAYGALAEKLKALLPARIPIRTPPATVMAGGLSLPDRYAANISEPGLHD